jgi:serine/threonine-protein kinase
VEGVPSEAAVGTIIDDKYRVERELGSGAVGVVVEAVHLHLDERVAIKIMLPSAMRSADDRERFLREARAAVKLKSEHVARVTDVGTLSEGLPYIVMESSTGSSYPISSARTGIFR